MVSYERAKAESLGLSAKGGLMERGERMFLLGVAFLSAAIFVPVLWVLFALDHLHGRLPLRQGLERRLGPRPCHRTADRGLARGPGRLALAGLARGPRVERPRPGATLTRTTGAPVGRWRARRQETLSSRSGRTLRERRSAARGHANGNGARRISGRRTPPPAP